MFTGLVRTQGTIRSIETRGDVVMTIESDAPLLMSLGASINCHGMCLTVTGFDQNKFSVSLSQETLNCTNAGSWKVGTRINLEPSLAVGDALGGHFVSGHVDGLGKVVRSEVSGASTIWEFEVASPLSRFIAAKGSITIDGVSLTVNQVTDDRATPHFPTQKGKEFDRKPAPPSTHSRFTVNIIPHTSQVTGFGALRVGDTVNLEIDMLARYVARLHECVA